MSNHQENTNIRRKLDDNSNNSLENRNLTDSILNDGHADWHRSNIERHERNQENDNAAQQQTRNNNNPESLISGANSLEESDRTDNTRSLSHTLVESFMSYIAEFTKNRPLLPDKRHIKQERSEPIFGPEQREIRKAEIRQAEAIIDRWKSCEKGNPHHPRYDPETAHIDKFRSIARIYGKVGKELSELYGILVQESSYVQDEVKAWFRLGQKEMEETLSSSEKNELYQLDLKIYASDLGKAEKKYLNTRQQPDYEEIEKAYKNIADLINSKLCSELNMSPVELERLSLHYKPPIQPGEPPPPYDGNRIS